MRCLYAVGLLNFIVYMWSFSKEPVRGRIEISLSWNVHRRTSRFTSVLFTFKLYTLNLSINGVPGVTSSKRNNKTAIEKKLSFSLEQVQTGPWSCGIQVRVSPLLRGVHCGADDQEVVGRVPVL